MKIKTIKLGKLFLIGLPKFSNITLNCEMTWELGENEQPNWNEMWDTINHQLYIQSNGIDPSWISNKDDYKNFFKITIKQPTLLTEKKGTNV